MRQRQGREMRRSRREIVLKLRLRIQAKRGVFFVPKNFIIKPFLDFILSLNLYYIPTPSSGRLTHGVLGVTTCVILGLGILVAMIDPV
jgi:hypothetical protein